MLRIENHVILTHFSLIDQVILTYFESQEYTHKNYILLDKSTKNVS